MSRPNMSVQKMKSDAGLRKRNRTFSDEGSSEVSSGAKMAASASRTMITKPITKDLCLNNLRIERPRRGGARRAEVTMASKPISVMAHPGIGERVEYIDDQADQHKGEAEDQHGSLHQRIIAGQDRLHDHPADTRQREHLLDDNRAANRRAQ